MPKLSIPVLVKSFDLVANKRFVSVIRLYHRGGLCRFISIIKHYRNRKKYSCMVPPTITIGTGFRIPHAVGIIMGETTEIGDNCTIFPNAMIIARHSPHKKNPTGRRHAKIGDNCVVGAGAVIIGDITIGHNVSIGANAIVSKDVPDNTVVINVNEHKAI